MEAFSLLKYWRGGGGAASAPAPVPVPVPAGLSTPDATPNAAATTTTAILTAVAQNDVETDDDDDSDDDDGPFFDLEFTLPDEADDSEDAHQNPNDSHTASNSQNHSEEENDRTSEDSEVVDDDDDDDGESEREIKFTLSPSSNDHSDPNLSVPDDVLFKGKLVQLEPSSFVLNPSSEPNSKPPPQFTASLLKSATKFRVFMLGLKKPKPNANAFSEKDPTGSDPVTPNPEQPPQEKTEPPQQRKLFTVKFKVEEVPIMSLFTRDNSSRGKASATSNKKDESQPQTQSLSSASDDKRLVKKYLRMVKPLYVRVSRKYAEKLRFSGQLNVSDSVSAAAERRAPPAKAVAEEKEGNNNDDASEGAGTNVKATQKQGNLPLPAGLRVVCKHLGKSRSASSAAVTAAAVAPAASGLVSSRRRDDSLLQQQDGIQGAILHCKKSFNASREGESSQLPRSVSDPLHEVSPELSRKSTNEGHDNRP